MLLERGMPDDGAPPPPPIDDGCTLNRRDAGAAAGAREARRPAGANDMRPAPTAAVAVGANDIRAFVAIKPSPAFDDRDGPNDGRGWFAEIGPSVCRLISFFL